MRSLSLKLTIAFLITGVLGAGLVAILVGWQTERQFDRFVHDLYRDDLVNLEEQLADHYVQNGSWVGIDAVLVRDQSGPFPRRPFRWMPVTLVDANRVVVSGGWHNEVGQKLSRRDVNPGVPIEVKGNTVGWLVFDSFAGNNFPRPDSPESAFLANVNRATLLSALGASLFALFLGVVLARTISNPVGELTAATRIVASGELGHQVPVRTKDELGELATSFNQMSADLAHSNQLRRQMTADIAHDLRTPMSVIMGYAEALSDGKLQGNQETYEILYQEAKHLNHLIDDLRILSLADAGELPLACELFPPQALLERAALTHRVQAEQQGITLRVHTDEDLGPVFMDPERMTQVLGNLISNALRYTPTGGTVWLKAQRMAGKGVRILVQDSGAGIPPEELPHIFSRFFRGDKSRHGSGESGLGLAIARSMVEAQGGSITAESTPGQGSTFAIIMPLPAA